MFAKMSPPHIWLVRWKKGMRVHEPLLGSIGLPHSLRLALAKKNSTHQVTNLKLENRVEENGKLSLWAFHGSPFSLPWIFSKLPPSSQQQKHTRHGTPRNTTRYRFDETLKYWEQPPKKGRTKSKGGRILFDKTWISEQTYHWNIPHLSSPDYKKPLQLRYICFGCSMFGYSKMKPPKTFSMPSNISKRGFCFKKALPCQAKTRATSKWGVLCIDGPAKACICHSCPMRTGICSQTLGETCLVGGFNPFENC